MNSNTSESNALLEQEQKRKYIDYLVKNGFNRSILEGYTLATLQQKANAISLDNFQMEMRKGGKGKSKSKRKSKRKGSRRHKTRRHFKK